MVITIAKKVKKEDNTIKLIVIGVIGCIIVIVLASYMSARDSAFTDDQEIVFEESKNVAEDSCRRHCINKLGATNYNLDGVDCKCWFTASDCREYCTDIGAYGFDLEDDYCRCWFQ